MEINDPCPIRKIAAACVLMSAVASENQHNTTKQARKAKEGAALFLFLSTLVIYFFPFLRIVCVFSCYFLYSERSCVGASS